MKLRRKWILFGLLVALVGVLGRPTLHIVRAGGTIRTSRTDPGRIRGRGDPHVSPPRNRSQFRAAYPQADRFFALKREYDPGELFQSRFYKRYGLRR